MRRLLEGIVTLAAVWYLLNQFRRPTRWFGRIVAWTMNHSHSAMTDWGLNHLEIGPQFTILDVGCGGGRTIEKLAAHATDGLVCGIDHAAGSVAASRQRNARLIAAGRVDIRDASVSQLPFPNDRFDLVTAVETHYYWPDLVSDLKEIRRVIRPGGALLILAEHHKGGRLDTLVKVAMKALRATHLSLDEYRALLAEAGYRNVRVASHPNGRWFCALASVPA
jgi:ubiquinone/menaquinone biosynthesis C-methylase UbiE